MNSMRPKNADKVVQTPEPVRCKDRKLHYGIGISRKRRLCRHHLNQATPARRMHQEFCQKTFTVLFERWRQSAATCQERKQGSADVSARFPMPIEFMRRRFCSVCFGRSSEAPKEMIARAGFFLTQWHYLSNEHCCPDCKRACGQSGAGH